jgi:8-oxo-dGTP pyrophosphatase MutT (NUDIX family)
MPDPDEIADLPTSYEVRESATSLHTGRVIDVRTDVVVFPDGSTATRDVVVHPGAVGIIALDDAGRVLLIRQYRHAVRQQLWEPPAGLLDEAGEDPLDAAKRELFEEAHCEAGRWDVLLDVFTTPGMADEAVRLYLARDVRSAQAPRHEAIDEERDMPLAWIDLDDAADRVLRGDLHNPLTAMGVLALIHARRNDFTNLRPADAPWPQMSPWPGSRASRI